MKTQIVMLALIVFVAGCAAPSSVRLIPVAGSGAAVTMNMGANADGGGFWSQHWGKVLSGVVAAGGAYMVADHNGWLKGGESSLDQPEVAIPGRPTMGDGNAIVIGNTGSVSINIGNSRTE